MDRRRGVEMAKDFPIEMLIATFWREQFFFSRAFGLLCTCLALCRRRSYLTTGRLNETSSICSGRRSH